jgi:L-ribulose-5-phosphate 3-epimerase
MNARAKIGVSLESLGLPFRKGLFEAERIGASGVQVDAAGDLRPDRLTATGRRELRHLLRSHNLEFAALNCPLRRGLDTAEDQQGRIDRVRQVLSLSFDLGPRVAVVQCPKLPDDPATPRALMLREGLTDLGRHADRVGATLALEIGLDPPEKVRDYLDSFDTGGLAVNYDPANLLTHGHDPAAGVAVLGRRIVHTHARDARLATVSRTAAEVPVGAGDIDWMVYLAALEAVEYRGFLTVERESGSDRARDVAAGVAFLRRFTA